MSASSSELINSIHHSFHLITIVWGRMRVRMAHELYSCTNGTPKNEPPGSAQRVHDRALPSAPSRRCQDSKAAPCLEHQGMTCLSKLIMQSSRWPVSKLLGLKQAWGLFSVFSQLKQSFFSFVSCPLRLLGTRWKDTSWSYCSLISMFLPVFTPNTTLIFAP